VPAKTGSGYGTAMAKQYAAAAREAGADGLLVLPPYLIKPSQQGLLDHFRALAASTDLPLIAYQRDNAVFTPDSVAELARIPSVKGFKDGVGDLDLLQRMMAVAPDLTYFNGLPTAEVTARSYAAIGVKAYSSAVHCFAPEIAHAYEAGLDELLAEFYLPLVKLRDQGAGYAVSLVKAAVRRRGIDVGSVRSPLTDPLPEHLEELDQLLEQGLTVVRKAAA
jgi:5-dehydro-4-deoxyglucarate dehydratase